MRLRKAHMFEVTLLLLLLLLLFIYLFIYFFFFFFFFTWRAHLLIRAATSKAETFLRKPRSTHASTHSCLRMPSISIAV